MRLTTSCQKIRCEYPCSNQSTSDKMESLSYLGGGASGKLAMYIMYITRSSHSEEIVHILLNTVEESAFDPKNKPVVRQNNNICLTDF